MIPALIALARAYIPYITFPISVVVGIIGYNIEGMLSDKSTPTKTLSIKEERAERQLNEMEGSDQTENSLKAKKFVPKTIFEKNVSPTLVDE